MNTQNHIPRQVISSAYGVAEKLQPLASKKDPVVAAIAAFALGGVGLGIYLRSWVDFFVPFLMLLILGVIAIPTGGLLAYFAPVFWAVYAYRRVKASNAKLDGASRPILEADIISEPTSARSFQISLPILARKQTLEDRLQRLDDLFKGGALTRSEYQEKRKEILSEI
jgi:hypothetical protein